MNRVPDNILVDTSFWIALLDPRDSNHSKVLEKADWLDEATIVVPWPILFETVRTRMARRKASLDRFNRYIKSPNVVRLDDTEYREDAYESTMDRSLKRNRAISMVDMLCLLMIEDRNIDIHYVLTTNESDFRDVCAKAHVTIL